jgi:hypothetical protein
MSLLDQLKALEADVAKRMRELEPSFTEYTELQKIAQRLGIQRGENEKPAASTKASGNGRRSTSTRTTRRATPAAASSTPKKRAGQSRGRSTNRAEDIIKLVAANPGITVSQLGKRLKVDPTGLYAPVRRLQQEGRIEKIGPNLQVAKR